MDSVLPFVTFAIAAAITPGPNNLMLAASGVAFGFRRTMPHLLGIPVGFSLLVLISGLGVGTIVTSVPAAALALKLFGSAYLLYLAWVMRRAFVDVSRRDSSARPIRFHEAAIFQFANPKAWIMSLSAVSVFVADASDPWLALGATVIGFVIVTLPCAAVWITLGVAAGRTLIGERYRGIFGAVILALMVYTVVAIWLE
jgi:threonine/homoserine/homoserine lactone efflux protein